jgi:hypothetical protein
MKRERPQKRPLSSSVELPCPFCGKVGAVMIDEGGGEHQTFVEDCTECCRPRVVHYDSSPDLRDGLHVWLERDDGM